MHILFDARVIQDHFPGIGRYAYNLLAALPAHLREEDTLTALYDPSAHNTRFNINVLRETGIEFVTNTVPIFSLPNLVRTPTPRHARPNDVIHYPYYVHPYTIRHGSVTSIFDLIFLAYPQLVPSTRTRLVVRMLNWLAIQRSDAIITSSQQSARDIAHFVPGAQRRTKVIYLAAETIFIPQSPERSAAIRAKYGLGDAYALFFASNKPHKNLARLIEAWRLVVNGWSSGHRNDTTRGSSVPILAIAGHRDPRYTEPEELARKLNIEDHVRFIGNVPNEDLPALYTACSVFVFPSLYEGFGLPPLEAMACGAPIVCSNTSSLPEIVGDAAILFDPTQPEDIARTCIRVLSDAALQGELRERALRQASRFTWDSTARSTIDIYRHMAKTHKQP